MQFEFFGKGKIRIYLNLILYLVFKTRSIYQEYLRLSDLGITGTHIFDLASDFDFVEHVNSEHCLSSWLHNSSYLSSFLDE